MSKTTIWARPGSRHYHSDEHCPMLQGGDFKRLGYTEVSTRDIARRKLIPCFCARHLAILIRKGRI